LDPSFDADALLEIFVDVCLSLCLLGEVAAALLAAVLVAMKWVEAGVLWDFVLTFAHNYYVHSWTPTSPYDPSTFGYAEQARIGSKHLNNVDSACLPSYTLACPYWIDDQCYPSMDTLYGSISTMVDMLEFLSGEPSSFTDQNEDGVNDFQDVLLYANEYIYPDLVQTGGEAGESHTFTRYKDVDGDLTTVREPIYGTGYNLEHGILEWCVGLDRSFSNANPEYTWNLERIGADRFGETSDCRVWEAAANTCGILYYGFYTVKSLRQTIETMLSFASDLSPPGGSISIKSAATYTTSAIVPLSLSSDASEMRLRNDGCEWGPWQKYASSVTDYSLNTVDGTRTAYAQFKDCAGNVGSEVSDSIILDRAAPTGVSIVINDGDTLTLNRMVSLAVSATDATSGLSQMQFSNDGSTWSSWESCANSRVWYLSTGDGTKTVYLKVKDMAGNIAGQVSDTIVLDTTAPTPAIVILDGSDYTCTQYLFCTVAASDSGTPVVEMRLSNDGVWDTEPWVAFNPYPDWGLTIGDGLKTVYLQVKDEAGFVSATVSDTIVLDTVNPTGSVTINGGVEFTTSPSVTLSISASDSISGIEGIRISNDDWIDEPLESYVTSKQWSLPSGDETKTVYVRIKDRAGNEITVSDAIILHTHPPIIAAFAVEAGAEYASTVPVTLSIEASDPSGGVNQMRFSNGDSEPLGWSAWEAYAAIKSWVLQPGDGVKTVNVQVSDIYGLVSSESDTIILNTGPPTAPLNLAATVDANGDVTLTWDPPLSSGGSALIRYQVCKGVTSDGTVLLESVSPSLLTATDTHVASGSLYYYTIVALNSEGYSVPSNEVSILIDTPVYSDNFDDGDISDWTCIDDPPDFSVIEIATPSGSASKAMHIWYKSYSVGRATSPSIACDFTSPYKISLRVFFPDPPSVDDRWVVVVDDGRVCVVASVGIYYSDPTKSQSIGAVTYNSWESIEILADPVSCTYIFVLNGVRSGPLPFYTSGTPGQTISFGSNAIAGTKYYGEAYWDDLAVFSMVPMGPPSAFSAFVSSDSIRLMWSIPSANAGNPVMSYKIYRGTSYVVETLLAWASPTQMTVTRDCFYYDDAAVTYGVQYYYRISAVTMVGEGPQSNEITATFCTAPSAPLNPVATLGDQRVTLTWSPPASDGWSPILVYTIYRSTAPGTETYLAGVDAPTTTYVDTAVTYGVTYYYQIAAWNGYFSGPRSDEVSAALTVQTAPAPPENLQAAPGDSQITLTWQAPFSNGGSAITNYKIYRGTALGGETYLVAVGNVLTYVDSGLPGGATYYYKVTAVNVVGEGPLSNEASATTFSVPTAPLNLQATAGTLKVFLVWAAPSFDGGTPITSYKIYRGTTSNGETFLASVSSTQLAYSDSGLTAGIRYYYKVTAVNAVGESGYSNEASAVPTAATAPTAPTGVAATATTSGIRVTWSPPTSDGGSPITVYNIYRSTRSGAEKYYATVSGTTLHYDDSSVRANKQYYYKVSAVNSVGEGPLSIEVSAVWTNALAEYSAVSSIVPFEPFVDAASLHLEFEAGSSGNEAKSNPRMNEEELLLAETYMGLFM
jgi:fibronectin type 3 domain-containing protein